MNYPKFIFLVTYKTKEGQWRGFCSPYDISCIADSKEEVGRKLTELVELYEEGLKKYGYPKHLTVKELSDEEDQKVFNIALKLILDDFRRKMINKYPQFITSPKKENVRLTKYFGTAEYYPPCYN